MSNINYNKELANKMQLTLKNIGIQTAHGD